MFKRCFSIIILLIVCFGLFACESSIIKYPPGKDTVYFFGDGTFQIGKTNINGERAEVLFYSPTGASIIPIVDIVHETDECIYIVGYYNTGIAEKRETSTRMLALIDPRTNTMQLCTVRMDAMESDECSVPFTHRPIEDGAVVILPAFSFFSSKEQDVFNDILAKMEKCKDSSTENS